MFLPTRARVGILFLSIVCFSNALANDEPCEVKRNKLAQWVDDFFTSKSDALLSGATVGVIPSVFLGGALLVQRREALTNTSSGGGYYYTSSPQTSNSNQASSSATTTKNVTERFDLNMEVFLRIPTQYPKFLFSFWAWASRRAPKAESLPDFAKYLTRALHGGLEITMRPVIKEAKDLLNPKLDKRGTSIEKAFLLYTILKTLAAELGQKPPVLLFFQGTARTENDIRSQSDPEVIIYPNAYQGMVQFLDDTFFPVLGIHGKSQTIEKDFVGPVVVPVTK